MVLLNQTHDELLIDLRNPFRSTSLPRPRPVSEEEPVGFGVTQNGFQFFVKLDVHPYDDDMVIEAYIASDHHPLPRYRVRVVWD